ncbi:hypothetical protein [Bacillus sp. TL12]|uniref:hypothetical protein n=1 Tax=Bacillus sp. TL12 TaxID=2894756 RepID=UPI001F52A6CD|nr:hypothetical protein [Bacillus sp. TL12]MCI0765986.1 hypothetical protein [Bacillus sp. TL12]
MKKVLAGGIAVSFLLAGCEDKTNTVQEENKAVNPSKDNKKEEKVSQKIQGSQVNLQVQSRYTVAMNSVEGDTYTLHVFANNEKHETQVDIWAGAAAGDEIYKGTYQLALQSTSSVLYLQEAQIGEFTFNTSRKSGFVSKGSPDFFVAVQTENSNLSIGKVFYINKGKVIAVTINDSNSEIGIAGNHFKALDKGKFMIANYDNGEAIWDFSTYQTDLETGHAKKIDTKKLPFEEGSMYVQENFE